MGLPQLLVGGKEGTDWTVCFFGFPSRLNGATNSVGSLLRLVLFLDVIPNESGVVRSPYKACSHAGAQAD